MPGEIRTPDHLVRSQVLYPAGYGHNEAILYGYLPQYTSNLKRLHSFSDKDILHTDEILCSKWTSRGFLPSFFTIYQYQPFVHYFASRYSRYQHAVLAGLPNVLQRRRWTLPKMLFMIPLPMELGINDYAFPSGHMLAASTIYGFIAYHESHLLPDLHFVSFCIAFGLIHHQYHNIYDVSAAAVIAATTIIALHQPLTNQYTQTLFILTVLGTTIALLTPYGNQIRTKYNIFG